MQKEVKEILNKQLLRQKPTGEQFTAFTEALRNLKDSIRNDESEEFNKNLIMTFLKDAFYRNRNLVNTAGYIDCAIYETTNSNSPIEVIIEAKSPNNSAEFPSRTNLNCKAMQELVLYFMRERFGNKNITLKHLVITNGNEWFVIDATEFEKHFANDKKFFKAYDDWDNKRTLFSNTRDFYSDIAKEKIDQVKKDISFLYFDIRTLKQEHEKLRFYRVMQPAHLLKEMKFADSNKLNTAFYNELLHIIGLEEHKVDGKTVIERKPQGHRNTNSLLESTIYQLEDYDITDDNEKFDIALNLVITWINRLLFLKLLESQLISYHGNKNADKYRFLSPERIKDYDDLNELFFKVLAVPMANRSDQVREKYQDVPYLNSSLFELTDREEKYFRITGLKLGVMPLFSQTVLKDVNGHHMKMEMETLAYLFRFLEAYDFGSDQSDDITKADNKTLINASVLGLIFEKINGYKDGSYFTPAFITQYMCCEAIERTVIQKFNDKFGYSCQSLTDIHNEEFDKQEAIKLLDEITLCDPAVGSGHFLVSALNRLIAIRAELGLLYDENGKRLKDYNFAIDNDELIVTDEEGEIFHYNPNSVESQRVQKTLFDLKRQIIENNLFGVDINPNSVNICRLRLWIELLKNAYYREDTHELETLPNIDINIKCGNSLLSRYPVRVGFYGGFNDNQLKSHIEAYKNAVREYKAMSNKEHKKVVAEQISLIKSRLLNPASQLSLFDQKQEISKEEQLLQNANPLEWMIEFPEVLNDEGVFLGFDIVIGNPPYGVKLTKEEKKQYRKIYPESQFKIDTYSLFVLQALQLTHSSGVCYFIIPNTLLDNYFEEEVRKKILKGSIIEINDLSDKVFDAAVVHSMIFGFSNKFVDNNFIKVNTSSELENANLSIPQNYFVDQLQTAFSIRSYDTNDLSVKLKKDSVRLVEVLDIRQAIKTGNDQLYIAEEKLADNFKPILRGKDIGKYITKDPHLYVNYGKHLACPRSAEIFEQPKILIREAGASITATLDEEHYYIMSSLYNAILIDNTYSLKYLLGLINSKLFQYLMYKLTFEKTKGAFTKAKIFHYYELPVKIADADQQKPIVDLVDAILLKKQQDKEADTSAEESAIDNLVYDLYGLTDEESKLIEESK